MTGLTDGVAAEPRDTIAAAEEAIRERVARLFRRSFHLRHVDAGSCNGCEAELRAVLNPFYDLQRLGIFIATSPRHADGLLVTGPITAPMRAPLLRTYEAMPEPRLVIAVGACAVSGGVFAASPLIAGPLDRILAVDVFIPGCPPSPLTILHGLLLALDRVDPTR